MSASLWAVEAQTFQLQRKGHIEKYRVHEVADIFTYTYTVSLSLHVCVQILMSRYFVFEKKRHTEPICCFVSVFHWCVIIQTNVFLLLHSVTSTKQPSLILLEGPSGNHNACTNFSIHVECILKKLYVCSQYGIDLALVLVLFSFG